MPEMVEEKQEKQPPAPSPAASRGVAFPKLARCWIVLACFCWAATLYHVPKEKSWFWDPPIAVIGGLPVRPMLPISVLFGGILVVVAFRYLKDRLEWFKPGQGRWVRAGAYAPAAALTFFGCAAFYQSVFQTTSPWWRDIWSTEVFGKVAALKAVLFPSAAIFMTVLFGAFLFLNSPKASDFLIETEGELKKVTWPARKEYVGSSFVVVLLIAIVSSFLYLADEGLSRIMKHLGIGF